MSKGASEMLLAKRPGQPGRPRSEETLAGHTLAVVRAAKAILYQLDASIPEIFGLSRDDMSLLRRCVLRAALLHDLGKANHQFQNLMRGKNQKQALRHEWLSAWLSLWNDDFAAWLFQGDDDLRDAVLCAVLGHHLKAGNGSEIDVRNGSGDIRLCCFWGHGDLKECLAQGAALLDLDASVPELENADLDLTDRPLRELRLWLVDDLGERGTQIAPLAKALLMAADIAGSAVPFRSESDMDVSQWIAETLSRRCTKAEIDAIACQRLAGHASRTFQRGVRDTSHRVALVRAGCGSGKTVAAYMWAAKRANGCKLFICYPTTGTATEGYRDYLIASGMEDESALLHSRSDVDIERILLAESLDRHDPGLGVSALVSWDVPITVCTADTVLGIIQNSRRSLYSSPAFMNAAFVFDEIHQYDSRMWGALLRFLEFFRGAPVLLMTASLPESRRQSLERLLGGNLSTISGPSEHETLPRYRLRSSGSHPWSEVQEVLEQGGKALWVSNTVSRCVEVGKEAEKRFPNLHIIPYHSRYRYCDRLERHNELIEAFKGHGPVLAVTTQVCEVSLDISADLLVTDLAPIPSLIQRLGRLNRRATEATPPRDAVVLEAPSPLPYDKQDMKAARCWLKQLADKPVSQQDLAKAFEAMADENEETGGRASEWLDGGKLTGQAPLREAGYTIPVVREEDTSQVGKGLTHRDLIRLEIPLLLNKVNGEINQWKRIRHVWLAPRGRVDYDEKWGAKWAEK